MYHNLLNSTSSYQCQAMVINAERTGVCFSGNKQYYIKKIPSRLFSKLRNDQRSSTIYLNNRTNSTKYIRSEQAKFDAITAARGTTAGFIMLDD